MACRWSGSAAADWWGLPSTTVHSSGGCLLKERRRARESCVAGMSVRIHAKHDQRPWRFRRRRRLDIDRLLSGDIGLNRDRILLAHWPDGSGTTWLRLLGGFSWPPARSSSVGVAQMLAWPCWLPDMAGLQRTSGEQLPIASRTLPLARLSASDPLNSGLPALVCWSHWSAWRGVSRSRSGTSGIDSALETCGEHRTRRDMSMKLVMIHCRASAAGPGSGGDRDRSCRDGSVGRGLLERALDAISSGRKSGSIHHDHVFCHGR